MLFDAFSEIIIKTGAYWLFVIAPAFLAIFGAIQSSQPEDKRVSFMMQIYEYLPPVVWMILAMLAFAITVVVGAARFIKKHVPDPPAPSGKRSLIDISGDENQFVDNKFYYNSSSDEKPAKAKKKK